MEVEWIIWSSLVMLSQLETVSYRTELKCGSNRSEYQESFWE